MKVKSLCSLTEAAGAEGAVKTAIKYQIENSTDLVPHHAAKSKFEVPIYRGYRDGG